MTAPTAPAPVPPLVEPRHAWDETPAQTARYDREHWTDRYDTDEEN